MTEEGKNNTFTLIIKKFKDWWWRLRDMTPCKRRWRHWKTRCFISLIRECKCLAGCGALECKKRSGNLKWVGLFLPGSLGSASLGQCSSFCHHQLWSPGLKKIPGNNWGLFFHRTSNSWNKDSSQANDMMIWWGAWLVFRNGCRAFSLAILLQTCSAPQHKKRDTFFQ